MRCVRVAPRCRGWNALRILICAAREGINLQARCHDLIVGSLLRLGDQEEPLPNTGGGRTGEAYWCFHCPECGFGSHELGRLAEVCEVCLE
ncbi:MAG: hypothetical protein JO227_05135 [Acetobacteraceae bacterium]|nr:hypothetical protein [Acetobacteraceae bacterium]